MKYLSFNSEKSLNQEKLIFNEPLLFKFLEYFRSLMLVISPIILGAAFFYLQLNLRNAVLFPFSIATLVLSFLISPFFLLQIKKFQTLRKVKGKENRKVNMKLIENFCNKNELKILHKDNNSHVILIENFKIAYHNGKELYLLYKDNTIYIRCLTYSMHNYINPFHWNSQRKIENMFIEKLL